MTRVFIVGAEGRQAETLTFLQAVGVLHVEPSVVATGEIDAESVELAEKAKRLGQVIDNLSAFRRKTPHGLPSNNDDILSLAGTRLLEHQNACQRIQFLERMLLDLSPWGDFCPVHVQELEKAGVYIKRYRMDAKNWERLEEQERALLQIVAKKQSVLFYVVSLDEPLEIPFATALSLPEMGINDAVKELDMLKEQLEALNLELVVLADQVDVLKNELRETLNQLSFLEKVATLHNEPFLFGVQGWIPEDELSSFNDKIANSDLSVKVVTREPNPQEEPPVLLRNNWLIQRIAPLLNLYGLPRYRHLDPSYFFAPFMILFFGICLSDAGYGVLVYLISYFVGKKLHGKSSDFQLVVNLCKAFAIASIVVGVLTGSVFGYKFEERSWILLDIDVKAGNPMSLFYLSLGLGTLHLTISYVMGIIQGGFLHEKLQKLGVIFVIWGGVSLISRNIWFSLPGSFFHGFLFYAGIASLVLGLSLTLVFASNSSKFLVRLGTGLWNIYGLTGLIGDLLSYARLFGLGIATSAIASVMNQLAGMAFNAMGPIMGVPVGITILFVGHLFNLALSLLGSTVHSARLHFVEAFKNFFEGGGIEYKPFKHERG
ncbi:MAG: hypothetical protein K9K75_03795 [Deltaproteobacteria bacterium]|nr:hypothetical protein [Deltaproteobacteria bacterium]